LLAIAIQQGSSAFLVAKVGKKPKRAYPALFLRKARIMGIKKGMADFLAIPKIHCGIS